MKEFVSKFDFFSNKLIEGLSDVDRKRFNGLCEEFFFRKKSKLFYEEGIPTGVYMIKKGRVKKYKSGIDGKEQIFYIYKEGDLLGYHAILCNERYQDSCETIEDSYVWFISIDNFNSFLESCPSFQEALIRNLSHEFGVLANVIAVLAQKSLSKRLAIFLLILEGKFRVNSSDIKVSREDLSNIIGTTRESLGRLLKEFKDQELIGINNRSITILNRESLFEIAK